MDDMKELPHGATARAGAWGCEFVEYQGCCGLAGLTGSLGLILSSQPHPM